MTHNGNKCRSSRKDKQVRMPLTMIKYKTFDKFALGGHFMLHMNDLNHLYKLISYTI